MKKIEFAFLTAALAVGLAACGNNDNTADAASEDSTIENTAGTNDMSLDASTSDAMSIDVAAGGIEPMADPMQAAPAETESPEPAVE